VWLGSLRQSLQGQALARMSGGCYGSRSGSSEKCILFGERFLSFFLREIDFKRMFLLMLV
jgi:hypothetical protein